MGHGWPMTPADLKAAALAHSTPPVDWSPEVRALWLTKAGQWDAAHALAQDIDSPVGWWIHALLHLIEGDEGNARYWFARAGRPPVSSAEQEAEWDRIAADVLGEIDA